MKKEHEVSLKDFFHVFEDALSSSDIMSSKVLSEISAYIVKSRAELGMTQKQFAKYMNVSQGMVSKWESSDYNFSVKTLADLAAKLGTDLTVSFRKPKAICYSEDKFDSIASVYSRHFIYSGRKEKTSYKNGRLYMLDTESSTIMKKEVGKNDAVREWVFLCGKQR